MCLLLRRVVRQLTQMTKIPNRDTYRINDQMQDVFRSVFYYRLKNEYWPLREQYLLRDLLEENDTKLSDAYIWRVASDTAISDYANMMHSGATFLIDDFPQYTPRLHLAVHWADRLTSHRSRHEWEFYTEGSAHENYTPMFDRTKLPPSHTFWHWWNGNYHEHFTDIPTYLEDPPVLSEEEEREDREEEEEIRKMEEEGREQRKREEREEEEEIRKMEEEGREERKREEKE